MIDSTKTTIYLGSNAQLLFKLNQQLKSIEKTIKQINKLIDKYKALWKNAMLSLETICGPQGEIDDNLADLTTNVIKIKNDTNVILEVLTNVLTTAENAKQNIVDQIDDLVKRHDSDSDSIARQLQSYIKEYNKSISALNNILDPDQNNPDKRLDLFSFNVDYDEEWESNGDYYTPNPTSDEGEGTDTSIYGNLTQAELRTFVEQKLSKLILVSEEQPAVKPSTDTEHQGEYEVEGYPGVYYDTEMDALNAAQDIANQNVEKNKETIEYIIDNGNKSEITDVLDDLNPSDTKLLEELADEPEYAQKLYPREYKFVPHYTNLEGTFKINGEIISTDNNYDLSENFELTYEYDPTKSPYNNAQALVICISCVIDGIEEILYSNVVSKEENAETGIITDTIDVEKLTKSIPVKVQTVKFILGCSFIKINV